MRRPILAAVLALLALPASAQAGFFPAEVIDGPNPDLLSVEEVDISREGTGGLVFLKRDAGVPHVFFSPLNDGAFGTPVRADAGLAPETTQASLGASGNGRMAMAYVNGGSLFTQVKSKDAAGFAAPVLLAQGGVSNPSIDVSINGATYVSFTQNGDVRIARADRDSPQFTVLPTPVDVNPAAGAGDTERKASKVDVSADGSAIVVWTEGGPDGRNHVHARRVFEQRLSAAPQDLTVGDVQGVPATGADTATVDMEDDSSYAQVIFRQNTVNGPRVLMRRLVGSTFEPAEVIDGGLPGDSGDVDLTGRGEGLFGVAAAGGQVIGGTIFNNRISGQTRLDPGNAVSPQTQASLGENEDGVVSFLQGTSNADAAAHARLFEGVEFLKLSPDTVVSNPTFGPVIASGGLKSDASRAGDVAMVFLQGGNTDRRLVAGYFDKPPTRIAGANSTKIRKLTRLAWADSLNLFGGTKYTVVVDGKPLGETTQNEFIPAPGQVPDGNHTWQVTITDRRGQQVTSRTRRLRVDNTPPTLRFGVSRRGRVLTISAKGADPAGRLPSGLGRILVDWGDGKLVKVGRRARKRYSRKGSYTVRVKAVDKAGNETVKTRRVRIG
jgi:hypothetical protein